ncbi:hypothetical protein EC973_000685 [Apophysomyces ossiformis]|uniref:Thioesterase domain-containing protein n=1 Tax=Apophysomyces ossiformis TaxID=679940 RepID=A0A8H7ESF6_9FUNG|nr:hypothetical protein EC973_000685 [Apophysomyces ossiformis]
MPTGIARLQLVTKHLAPASIQTQKRALASEAPSSKEASSPPYRARGDYKYFLPIQSRWSDQDQYGHINNAIYYHYIDTVVNEYLIKYCGLDPSSKTQPIGLVVSSSANFYASASYPSVLEVGLTVAKIGRTSITYRVGVFENQSPMACVVGGFTHVFVDPIERRPVEIPETLRIKASKISA